jgi:hypothetical protein
MLLNVSQGANKEKLFLARLTMLIREKNSKLMAIEICQLGI